MAAPICLVVYLKPNGAEIQMSVVGRMSAYGTAAANRAEHAGTAPSVQRKGLTKCPGGALTGIEPDANQRCDRNNPTLSCTAALRWTACARRPAYPSAAAEDGKPMTTTYGFDLARPRSRRSRIERIDALATLLDTALVIPGTGVRFGLDALIGFFPVVGDTITTALSLFIV